MSTIPSPEPLASQMVDGLMSKEDKTKLDAYPSTPSTSLITSVTQANGLTLTAGVLAMASSVANWTVTTLATLTETLTSLVRAAGATLVLRSDLGNVASDVIVKVGTSVADGSVNSTAKLWSARTGIGGTEVEKLYIDKNGDIRSPAVGLGRFRGSSTTSGLLSIDDTAGSKLTYGNQGVIVTGSILLTSDGNYTNAYVGTGTSRSAAANGASAVGHIFDTNASWTNVGAKLVSFRTANAEMASISSFGRLDQSGSDSSGTPGDATIAKPIGTSAIAAGASTCVITNTIVAAGDWVMITPHARDATCKELIAVCTANTITVSGSANATATLPFSWEVKKRL